METFPQWLELDRAGFPAMGPATSAVFAGPNDIAGDGFGSLYVIDFNNLRLRKIGADGIINSVTGGLVFAIPREGDPASSANLGGLFGLSQWFRHQARETFTHAPVTVPLAVCLTHPRFQPRGLHELHQRCGRAHFSRVPKP